MTATNGTKPKELTAQERDAALKSQKSGPAQMQETKRLMEGVSLFVAGDWYERNRSNLYNRAVRNGFVSHVRRAIVDGEEGYVCWWDRVVDR